MSATKDKVPTLPPTTDENEVLRRMLHTPPKPHKEKSPAKKKVHSTKKP